MSNLPCRMRRRSLGTRNFSFLPPMFDLQKYKCSIHVGRNLRRLYMFAESVHIFPACAKLNVNKVNDFTVSY